jgi:hypothetical protein
MEFFPHRYIDKKRVKKTTMIRKNKIGLFQGLNQIFIDPCNSEISGNNLIDKNPDEFIQ